MFSKSCLNAVLVATALLSQPAGADELPTIGGLECTTTVFDDLNPTGVSAFETFVFLPGGQFLHGDSKMAQPLQVSDRVLARWAMDRFRPSKGRPGKPSRPQPSLTA